MTHDELLADLDADQREAATTLGGPIVILAGAGSGKTTVITRRIALGVRSGAFDPAGTVAVTFTAKAAGEMTRRLRRLGASGVRVRTFHAAALRQLSHYWPLVSGSELPKLIAQKAPLVGAAASGLRLPTDQAAIRDASSEIEWAKVRGIHPGDYARQAAAADRTCAGLGAEKMAELFAAYEARKDAAGRIDFEDVLLLMVGMLEGDHRVAGQVRRGLRHLTVDEYQDVSPIQQRLIDGWLGDNDNLCVVGDPMQTIYTFAGADSSYLTGFGRRYPDAVEVRLETTYRCGPQIVRAANAVLTQAGGRLRLRAARKDDDVAKVVRYDDEDAEAVGVAAAIADLTRGGVRARDIAILYRLNAMSERFEQALTEAGVTYRVAGGTGFFRRQEVRRAMAVLRGAAVSQGTASVGDEQEALPGIVGALLSGLGWTPQPPAGTGALREAWESLAAIESAARDYAADHPDAGLGEFTTELAERAGHQDAPDPDGVTLASLHAAKGMEWPVVFLVGAVEGVLPHGSATDPGEVDEERRLFYVGVTRARDRLEVSWAASRGNRSRTRSRFLDAMAPAAAEPAKSATPGKRPARGVKARRPRNCECGRPLATAAERKLGHCRECPTTVDVALLEALVTWRAEVAGRMTGKNGGRMPAYVIATDATLAAVAERKPTNADELADVPGIGPAKMSAYGDQILEVIAAHAEASHT